MSSSRPLPTALALLALLACPLLAPPVLADLAEISGPGETPFRPTKLDGWTWEDLGPLGLQNVTYTVYRSTSPDAGFDPVLNGAVAPSWAGDPEEPADAGVELLHYLVTANDLVTESAPGGDRAPEILNPERCADGSIPAYQPLPLTLEAIDGDYEAPMHLTQPVGDDRLFVLEQLGVIRWLRDGVLQPEPFLDITDDVIPWFFCNECGALGLAFHPDFATNGLFYVYYSSQSGTCAPGGNHCAHLSEFRVSATDPNVADRTSERIVLEIEQPRGNHNGGWLEFGPDGFLYLGLGDGGSQFDPDDNGQRLDTPLGSILRIDVDGRDAGEYSVPADNPFVDTPGALPEIFAHGLRNPWRCSFDRGTGDLWIGDVGQNEWEEIDWVTPAMANGANFGWRVMEGSSCVNAGCTPIGIPPVHEYDHGDGRSVTGGVVYRGCRMPFLQGRYFFADFVDGWVDSLVLDGGVATDLRRHPEFWTSNVASFGQDQDGEVYLVDRGGAVAKIVPNLP